MDSRRLGYLTVGEEIVGRATEMSGDVLRVQFDRGWVSVFWNGKDLLELLSDDMGDHPHEDSDGEEEHHDEPGTPRLPEDIPPEEFKQRVQWVVDVPLFRDLDDRYVQAIASALETRAVAPGTVVIAKGAVGEQEMYFVAKGKLEVLMSLDLPAFAKLRVGKFFGESSLLDYAVRSAYVRARRPSILHVLRKESLKEILRDSPEVEALVGEALKKHLAELDQVRTAADRLLQDLESSDEDEFDWEDEVTPRASDAAAAAATGLSETPGSSSG
jgi:CRP-like cAMP-binding protein